MLRYVKNKTHLIFIEVPNEELSYMLRCVKRNSLNIHRSSQRGTFLYAEVCKKKTHLIFIEVPNEELSYMLRYVKNKTHLIFIEVPNEELSYMLRYVKKKLIKYS